MKSYTTEVGKEYTEFHRELSGPLCLLRSKNEHTPLPQKTNVEPPLLPAPSGIEGTLKSSFQGGGQHMILICWTGMLETPENKDFAEGTPSGLTTFEMTQKNQ